MLRVAFDIGGTFTDFVLHDSASGKAQALKVLSTPQEPAAAVVAGLERLLEQAGVQAREVDMVLHATTVATNAVLERKGASTGLIATQGFRDIIIIGRQKRYETYDLYINKPRPLVERRHIHEVRERVGADGSVIVPLDMASVDKAIDALVAAGRDAVAISLMHSYARPEHEQRIRDRFARKAPHIAVSISSEVSPKYREYERTSTTLTNAYVRPIVDTYLGHLEKTLHERGFRNHLFVMQSSGGLISPELARRFPVRIIESGPAAGVLMCAKVGKIEGQNQVITFDMGGTTAKLGAVDGSKPAIMPTFEVDLVRYKKGSGLPLNVSAVEMIEIGAGGGSIARADNKGMIVVGPESAGADPGPICYGNGGDKPTITDANVVLGYISPDWFNGGAMTLDAEAAAKGIQREIGDPLGLSAAEAAWGIHLVATANMENAMRVVSVERGRDPRRYAMVAFGGAGPLHAARLARSIGIPTVIVPFGAGVGSAIGLLEAQPRVDVTATKVVRLDEPTATSDIADLYRTLETQVLSEVKQVERSGELTWTRYAQMRYAGQGFEIHVDLPSGPIDASFARQVTEAFNEAYMRRHKFLDRDGVIEGVDWTLVATAPAHSDTAQIARHKVEAREQAGKTRQAWFPESGGFVSARVVDRQALAGGATVEGPAIIEDPDSTTVILPGDVARISVHGHLIIDINKGTSK